MAVVAYGPTRLCAACDALRSSVGKGTMPRPVPAAELGRLIDAARAAGPRHLPASVEAKRHDWFGGGVGGAEGAAGGDDVDGPPETDDVRRLW